MVHVLRRLALPILIASSAVGFASAQEADVAKGEQLFKRCMACHAVGEDARNKIGPVLNGVAGAPWAHIEGFNYSPALKKGGEEGKVWDDATLSEFLENPRKAAPGTKMAFPGLREEQDRTDIIAYLKQFNAEGGQDQ